jgi:membrane-bound lytic murein transglycosylase D
MRHTAWSALLPFRGFLGIRIDRGIWHRFIMAHNKENSYLKKEINRMQFMKWILFLVGLFVGFMPQAVICAESPEEDNFPSLLSSLKIETPLNFCNEKVPLDDQEILERFEKAFMLALWNRAQIILWLKRSTRYLPLIEEILKEGGLPVDLKYVAIAESDLRPHAGSGKGAMGFWQIMPGTARKYGLKVNRYVDERRNVFSSTRAVIPYFKDLYDAFGSWTLAAAAFNRGENGVMKEVLAQGTKDYYRLYLPIETQQFILRIISIKLIFAEPEKYGYRLSEEDYYPPLSYDTVEFKCTRETPILLVAQAANADFKDIKNLNPEIRGRHLASGEHRLLIPKGAAEGFETRYKRLEKEFLTTDDQTVYVVEKGDNLSSIAEKFDVPLAALLIWNRLDLRRPIHPGDRIIIFPKDEMLRKIKK